MVGLSLLNFQSQLTRRAIKSLNIASLVYTVANKSTKFANSCKESHIIGYKT